MTDDSGAQSGDEGASSETTDNDEADGNGNGAPHVDLSMYQLSVTVHGSHGDSLDDVSEAARELMDYLAEKSLELEERPDNRGLG